MEEHGMPEPSYLDALAGWFDHEVRPLSAEDTVVSFGRTDGRRPKHAAWIGIERYDRVGELTVWDSGEVELIVGSEGNPEIAEHHEINCLPELRLLLENLLKALGLSITKDP
jgi:hypothetical protein